MEPSPILKPAMVEWIERSVNRGREIDMNEILEERTRSNIGEGHMGGQSTIRRSQLYVFRIGLLRETIETR